MSSQLAWVVGLGLALLVALALLLAQVLRARGAQAKQAEALAEAQRLQAALDEQAAAAQKQAAQLARAVALQADWGHIVSGELAGSAEAVARTAHLLAMGELTPHQRDHLSTIDAASHRMSALLADLADSALLEDGRLSLVPAHFNVDALIQSFGEALSFRGEAQDRELIIEVEPDVPPSLVGDALRLKQLLDAQLRLALALGTPGSDLLIHIGPDQARVGRARIVAGDPFMLRFELSAGSGDARPVTLPKDASLSAEVHGKLIEMMSGSCGVRPVPGRGQVVWFTARMEVGKDERAGPANPSFDGHRVLVVDNNERARVMLANLLTNWGLIVTTAATGFAAIQAVVSAEESRQDIKLILLDADMPELSGLETVRLLAARGLREMPKLVLLSRDPAGTLLTQAQGLGVAEVLAKPLGRKALRETLVNLMGSAEASSSAQPGGSTPAVRPEAGLPIELQMLGGARVLLVEDNEINQQIALELLQASGMEVHLAAHGQAALDLLNWQYFDLVLMDLHMPTMDGLTATRLIRADRRHIHLPIVAMTAAGSQLEKRRCVEAGMNAHLVKPFELEGLWSVLQRWIVPRPGLGRDTPDSVTPVERSLHAETLDLPQRTPGLDVRRALRRMGNRIDLYQRTARMFIDTQADAVEQLREALNAGDHETALRIATTLKNLAGNLGAEGLQTESLALEASLREGLYSIASARTAAVEEALEVVCFALRSMLLKHANPGAQGASSDVAEAPP